MLRSLHKILLQQVRLAVRIEHEDVAFVVILGVLDGISQKSDARANFGRQTTPNRVDEVSRRNRLIFFKPTLQSLNLTVAQQTTHSLRSVIGAQLGGAIDLGWREKLALQFRLGWSHEYASTSRPVTATLGGAPLMPFTTYGIAPTRDGAVVGFSANTAIAEATSAYIRYEGNISGRDSAHALTAGVRMTW